MIALRLVEKRLRMGCGKKGAPPVPASLPARTSHRWNSDGPESARTLRWRLEQRRRSLELLATRSKQLRWSAALLRLLLEELWVDEEFRQIVDRPTRIPIVEYPRAVAIALALRHSWRRDDLKRTAKRLGLSVRDL